jgi:hypothetical protein
LADFSSQRSIGIEIIMAKNIKEQARTPKPTRVDQPLIPPKYQHAAAMALIYISLLVFFHSIIFDGKTYQSADTIASHSWETIYKDAKAQGIFPLWNPYIFCGMPGYASVTFAVERTFDITTFIWEQIVRRILTYFFFDNGSQSGTWLLYYLVYGIGVYLFAFQKLKNKSVAVIVALMALYATYISLLIMMGHMTKLAVLAWFPYVFLIVDKLREKFSLFWALILILVIRLLIEPVHVQFIYYIYLALGFYLLFYFVRALLKKENWRSVLISGATLLVASSLAFLMGADQYFSTLEYNPYSIRGANPIVQASPAHQAKTVEGGLDYDYATSYSFSPGELTTFFVPSWYGFGPLTYQGPLTSNQPQRLYFYLGQQPIVDGPQYMGIIVIILAIVGAYRFRKDPFVQFLSGLIVFALFVSFGRDLPFIYDLMYRFVPMFNKFRAPVLILMLVQFCAPLLAGYGITSFITERNSKMNPDQEKKWKYILGGLGLGVLVSLIGSSFIRDVYTSFFSPQEIGKTLSRSYGQLNPTVIGMFSDFISSSVASDILAGFILLFLVFGVFYLYQQGKLRSTALFGALIILVLFDLWRVGWKTSDPKSRQETDQSMAAPEYVKALQQDTTMFRVLKMIDGQPIYDNSLAYWRIQNAYGYQGAKLRAYQDIVDVAGLGNPLVWQLMNVKYLITNRDESNAGLVQVYNSPGTKVYAFQAWQPRVFFVNRCELSDSLSTLNKIAAMSFNPRDIAFLSKPMTEKIDSPLQGAEATVTHHGIQDIEVRATATGNNLLFLSETYYPKGWKAYLDGSETEIYRLNYLFRGVIIPQGTHTLVMKFEPATFVLGKTISLITNLIILGGIMLFLIRQFLLKREKVAITT